MSEPDPKTQLDAHLHAIEAACQALDAGDSGPPAARRIAEALSAIFQPAGTAPALLSRVGGTYARIASSVPKTHPSQPLFLPLVRVTLEMGHAGGLVMQASTGVGAVGLGETPRCHPVLGKAAAFRQVQAPDWWKSEPVFVIEHSRLSRRDLALGALADEAEPLRDGRPLKLLVPMNYGVVLEVPWVAARTAALRQMAHEFLGSPEFLKLAGRSRR